jgi:hypothetical protein
MIQAHQEASLSHPETQATHEAIINLMQGVDASEITPAHCVRLLRYQVVLVAEAPTSSALYRQAAADLQRVQRNAVLCQASLNLMQGLRRDIPCQNVVRNIYRWFVARLRLHA